MAYVALCKALYDYVAQAEDELTLTEDDYLYILESDDPEWWKAKLRKLDETGAPIQDSPDEGTVGLVPANYVEEAEPIRLSRALYDYEAQTEDELSMTEDELLRVYESDGVWLLVKKQGNDPLSGGEGRLGYVPANYVDEAEAVDIGAAPVTEHKVEEEEEDDEADTTAGAAAIPQIQMPQTAHLGKGDEIKMWPVSALDSKKKKKKGTLGIGNASLFFASESDKTPVQKISVLHIASHSLEKGKTLHLELSPEAGLSESTLDFHTGSKDAANQIVAKIEISKANALTAAAAPATSTAPSAAASAATSTHIPLPPPPPPVSSAGPAAAASALPPPTRGSSAILPPPMRKTVSFQSQNQEAAAAPEPQLEHGIAMYDFEAQGDDELTVTENEHLIILEKENDDWWKVRNDAGQEGVVPASYVEATDASTAAAASGGAATTSSVALAAEHEEEERRRQEEEETEAVAEAERQREAAEAERQAEQRRQMEEKERARREALKAQPAPAPPKLTQRPSTTEVSRAAKNVSIPTGRSAPERPKDGGGRSKPSPNNTRMWTDRTGQFKVEAEFLGFNQGKIRLHKMNGVVIEVAVEKMSDGDIKFLEDITGKKLNPTDAEIAASTERRRERERQRERQARANSGSAMSREERERERERRKEKEREQRRREQARSGPKRNVDWFEFFLAAGVDVDDCTRYASAFERDKIDETVLADLDSSTLRSLGLREGDVIRVSKFIDKKYRRDKSHSTSSSRQLGRANANTAADLERQIKADEELARKLQEQESAARRGDSVSPAPPQLFSGPDGTLKNNTRRGRPTPKSTIGSNVDAASLAAASESLARTTSPPARTSTVSPTIVRSGSAAANGFDDDAWTPRPPSTKPATPARPTIASPAPAATAAPPAPTPPPASAASSPVTSAPPADPNSALFEKLAAMKPPSASASPRPGASPSPASSFMGQAQQQYNPNAPRGPFAPVPANQGLLQPLVPTTGSGQFVPTKMQPQQTGMMGMQMMGMQGMQPQQTGWGMQGMGGMQPQMTGFNSGMGGMNQMGGMGGMNSSPFAGGQVSSQQTGFPGMQTQQTGFNNFGENPQQMMAQQTGFGIGSQQQMQQQQAAQEDKDKFNASNIFQQMKTGAFAKDPNSAPQSSDKYDALRPQPTGFQPGGVMPQFTGMGFGQQPQQQGYGQNGYGGFGGY